MTLGLVRCLRDLRRAPPAPPSKKFLSRLHHESESSSRIISSIIIPRSETPHKLMPSATTSKAKDTNTSSTSTPDVCHSNNISPKPTEKQSAVQYIYDSMRDPQKTLMRPTLRKMNSIDKSSSRSLGLLSIDMFPEDLELHADPTGGLLSLQADSKRSINSSDFVKDAFLSEPSLSSRDLQDLHQLKPQARSPVMDLTAKLERITTGDDIMGENIRLSSSEWVKDFEGDNPGPMPQSMFYDSSSSIPATVMSYPMESIPVHIDTLTLSPVSSSRGLQMKMQAPPLPPLSPTTSSSKSKTESTKTKSKKRRKRIIDESTSCEPMDNDVLFGRGGYTNNRPGNIHFRQEALRLRGWYEQSTKEEKYEISNILLESVKSRGGRFLEKGSDGKWHEVIGNGARRKASQALRERIKGRSGGLGSSLTTVKSVSGDEMDDVAGMHKYEI